MPVAMADKEIIHELQINLAASILASVATYIAVVVFRLRIPSAAYLLFWRNFAKDLVVVISEISTAYDPAVRRGAQPPLTPIGDAIVLGDFLRTFRKRLRADPAVVSVQDSDSFDRLKHRNLLIIGGPKYNFAAQACLEELDESLPYQFRRLRPKTPNRQVEDPEMKRFVGRDRSVGPDIVLVPERDLDYGCAVMSKNPYNDQRKVFIVAGLSNLSTMGVSEWLRRGRPLFWIRTFMTKGFEVIVECRDIGPTRVSNVRTRAVFFLRS
jgi:hypothetical protein